LQDLAVQSQKLERERAEHQARIDQAESRLKEALSAMKTEFGVASIAEARAKIDEMEATLKDEIEALTNQLKEVEA
jgi:hypothetical protein